MAKKVVLVIAPRNFRDEELFHTKEELEKAGIGTTIASTAAGTCSGALGGTAKAELTLDRVSEADFSGIVFVGGGGSSIYFDDKRAHRLAQMFAAAGKVVAAICIAPSTLANAGLLQGKRATAFPSEEGNLRSRGAAFTGEGVTVDGKIITADGPQSARAFGRAIVKAL
jgi:protease I